MSNREVGDGSSGGGTYVYKQSQQRERERMNSIVKERLYTEKGAEEGGGG